MVDRQCAPRSFNSVSRTYGNSSSFNASSGSNENALAPCCVHADCNSALAWLPTRSENQMRFWMVSRLSVWPIQAWPDAAQRTAKMPASGFRFL